MFVTTLDSYMFWILLILQKGTH